MAYALAGGGADSRARHVHASSPSPDTSTSRRCRAPTWRPNVAAAAGDALGGRGLGRRAAARRQLHVRLAGGELQRLQRLGEGGVGVREAVLVHHQRRGGVLLQHLCAQEENGIKGEARTACTCVRRKVQTTKGNKRTACIMCATYVCAVRIVGLRPRSTQQATQRRIVQSQGEEVERWALHCFWCWQRRGDTTVLLPDTRRKATTAVAVTRGACGTRTYVFPPSPKRHSLAPRHRRNLHLHL